MVGDNNDQSYRRGAVLGFTLAELLLLLLFLLLLLSAVIIYGRDEAQRELAEVYERAEQERIALRQAVADVISASLGSDAASDVGRLLTPEQLDEPLARLGRLSAENRSMRDELDAARSELTALREDLPVAEETVSHLRERNRMLEARLQRMEEESPGLERAVAGAAELEPTREPGDVLSAALETYRALDAPDRELPNELAQCRAAQSNQASQIDYLNAQCGREGDYPPCVYRDDGNIAYLYSVIIDGDGITVERGDSGSFRSLSWVQDLPDPEFGAPVSIDEFKRDTLPHFVRSTEQRPQCRFFVRIFDRGGTTRDEFLDLYTGVQDHFYHRLIRE